MLPDVRAGGPSAEFWSGAGGGSADEMVGENGAQVGDGWEMRWKESTPAHIG